jgi:4-nitrophenyl phosphatase
MNPQVAPLETSALEASSVDGLILDMDGVLWRGQRALPGLRALFTWLDAVGMPYVLATNNSSRRPEAHRQKLQGFGLDVPVERVLSAATVCAEQMALVDPPGTSVYVIGEEGLHSALLAEGFRILNPLTGEETDASARAELVVAGIDRAFDYPNLAAAALHIQRGARFIASNPDPSYPAEEGLLPGAGAIQAAIQAVTGVAPRVMGKPFAPIFESALSRLGLPSRATPMGRDLREAVDNWRLALHQAPDPPPSSSPS